MNGKVILAALTIFLCSGLNGIRAQEAGSSTTGSLTSEFLWAILAGMAFTTAGCVVDAVLKKVAGRRG